MALLPFEIIVFKYKVGDLVTVSSKADGYDRFYIDFEVEVDELGLIVECIEKHGACKQWYNVRFNKSEKQLDFEEWELELL